MFLITNNSQNHFTSGDIAHVREYVEARVCDVIESCEITDKEVIVSTESQIRTFDIYAVFPPIN